MTADLVGRSGLTVREWEQRILDDYLAGRRNTLSRPFEFEAEFYADEEDRLPIEKVLNPVTGGWVTLDEVVRVHVDDVERYLAEWASRCEAEWEARPRDPNRWGTWWGR